MHLALGIARQFVSIRALFTRTLSRTGIALKSIDDVEGVTQCSIEVGSGDFIEASDWFSVEVGDRDRKDVVAIDDAQFRKAVLGSEFNFGAYASNSSRDRSASNGGEHTDGCVSSENADGAPTSRRTQVGPYDVVSGYHAGAV